MTNQPKDNYFEEEFVEDSWIMDDEKVMAYYQEMHPEVFNPNFCVEDKIEREVERFVRC